jgi:hypothetical protein
VEVIKRWSWIVLVLGAAAVAAGVSAWYVYGALDGWPTWLLAGGGVLLIAWAAIDRERVGDTVATRQFGYEVGSGVLVLLAVALGVGVYTLSRRNDHTWDLTRAGAFTLSEHARGVAAAVDEDVQITAFLGPTTSGRDTFRDLARQFQDVSPKIHVDYVDPLAEPRLAEEEGITGDQGTVILKRGDRVQRIEGDVTEGDLVRALVLLASDSDHVVCWSLGHGEPDPDDEFSTSGLGAVRGLLERTNFTVHKLRIAQEGVPRECEVVIVARPEVEWFPYEREALAAALVEGRGAFVLLDPGRVPELAADLARYGVSVGDDMVVDTDPKNQLMGVDDPTVAVLSEENFAAHPITRNLGAAVVMPLVRSTRFDREREGLEGEELLRAGPASWGETEWQVQSIRPDPGVDLVGDVPVMVAVRLTDPSVVPVAKKVALEPLGTSEAATPAPATVAPAPALGVEADPSRAVPADLTPKPGGRLVVTGDSDFASNATMLLGNNADLFLNAVAWLVDEDDQIGERPPAAETLTITDFGQSMLCLTSVVLVPGAAALAALLALLRRRWQ